MFGIKNDVDFVAASFVSNKSDMQALRTFLDENGGSDIDIIAKIENRAGVDNIDEICEIYRGWSASIFIKCADRNPGIYENG